MSLLDLVMPLDRFSDHHTYPAAVGKVHQVFRTQGYRAAERKSVELAELYEDLYLSGMVGTVASTTIR